MNLFVWYSDSFDLMYHIILNNDSQETSAKNEYPVVLSNILSTFIMYSGNKRGLDVEVNIRSGYETLV